MGRKPTISRETLLDLAEEIVRKEGPAALTIAALAAAGGISKGGVQYSFASKDEIVTALVDRWTDQVDTAMGALPDDGDPIDFVRHYIAAMRYSGQMIDAKVAGLMMLYLRNPQNLLSTRSWYETVFDRLAGQDPRSCAARAAFLAVEGLFLMRLNGLGRESLWDDLLDDIEAQLEGLGSGKGWGAVREQALTASAILSLKIHIYQ